MNQYDLSELGFKGIGPTMRHIFEPGRQARRQSRPISGLIAAKESDAASAPARRRLGTSRGKGPESQFHAGAVQAARPLK